MSAVEARPATSRNDWRDAVWSSDLKPLRRLAALCYADHAGNDNTTHVWVSTTQGVRRTGMGRTAWNESRNELEATGWLGESRASTYRETGRYQLMIPHGQCRETDSPHAT